MVPLKPSRFKRFASRRCDLKQMPQKPQFSASVWFSVFHCRCFPTSRFYRLQTNHDMTPELCFEFCIGAGLDLFGLVGEDCRCGASLLNKDVWAAAGGTPRAGLLLPLSKQLATEDCPVRVYRWIGPFVSGGSVPEHLQMLQPVQIQ